MLICYFSVTKIQYCNLILYVTLIHAVIKYLKIKKNHITVFFFLQFNNLYFCTKIAQGHSLKTLSYHVKHLLLYNLLKIQYDMLLSRTNLITEEHL